VPATDVPSRGVLNVPVEVFSTWNLKTSPLVRRYPSSNIAMSQTHGHWPLSVRKRAVSSLC